MQESAEIVVGIDDSVQSRAALTWAAEHARTSGANLRGVHVLGHEVSAATVGTGGTSAMGWTIDTRAAAEVEEEVQNLWNSLPPESGWSLTFATGHIGPMLVSAAADAKFLVVGTGEHRGIERLLVGSVSHYVLNHATCPVVAVPVAPVPAV